MMGRPRCHSLSDPHASLEPPLLNPATDDLFASSPIGPISALLRSLTNERDGFDINRRDAMITAVQEPGRYFVSLAGARARVLDARAGILFGEQLADDILSVGTWEPSGYISRVEMRHMVWRVSATREPWPPSINR